MISQQDDLFLTKFELKNAPLAHRMRPQNLSEWVGHEKWIGANGTLTQWMRLSKFPSILLWGPPGVGKTTLAHLLSRDLGHAFIALSAVSSGVKDIKEAAEKARGYQLSGRATILFLDEIHRLNKSQQDCLLPFVEQGVFTLIGATTENPSFEVNQALLSRMRVVRLDRHTIENLKHILEKAINDPRGYQGKVKLSEEAISFLAEHSEGDARRALGFLESILSSLGVGEGPVEKVCEYSLTDIHAIATKMGERILPYDKASDFHYDTISAFIKSLRAGDPDATVYYLARMLESGEDPLFIARRMIIFASEDVGQAEWRALPMAIAARDAVETIGMPEARINLAHVAISLSLAAKSRASYDAIEAAIGEVRATGALPIPFHLRNAVTGLMKKEGYGTVRSGEESLLPTGLRTSRFYLKVK